MILRHGLAFIALLAAGELGLAQQPGDLKLNIDSSNRTIAVSRRAGDPRSRRRNSPRWL